MDLSSKLASNGKLTSDQRKKHLENNLCFYCGAGDYKLDSCPKKQTIVSSKLASNGKLTSDKHKKHLKNNLCLYCGVGDHKLDLYPKKQTTVSPKGYGALATASKKPLEK